MPRASTPVLPPYSLRVDVSVPYSNATHRESACTPWKTGVFSLSVIEFMGRKQAFSGTLPPGDAGTRATLAQMRALVLSGAKDFGVRETAVRVIQFSGAREHDPASQLGALFQYVRDQITFIGDVAGVETLQSPRYTLSIRAGDCDDRAVLLAAMARSIGIPTDLRFRAIAANPAAPGSFSHVYVVARVNGKDIALDPTYHSARPGYEYAKPFRVEDYAI